MWTCGNRKVAKAPKARSKSHSLSTNYQGLLIMEMFELIRTQMREGLCNG
jgi:hypothetical protein